MAIVSSAGRTTPVPFQVRTRLGRWLPICPRHRLVFPTRRRYEQHLHAGCSGIGWGPYPATELLRRLRGYRRIWWWQ